MNKEATDNQETAVHRLSRLLAQARAIHQPGDVTVVEEQVKVRRGFCRVVVVISAYGTHIEIGPRRGSNDQVTWTFREKDLSEAEMLLAEYLERD
jgi:hypothetical protein